MVDQEKLARLQAQAKAQRIGGKGTPRRKVIPNVRAGGGDDKKLQGALKKLGVQPIQGVEEVNMFRDDSNEVLHFTAPKVHASLPSNTFAIYGHGVEKELTELVPGILNQLGPDAIQNLKKIAESFQAQQHFAGLAGKDKEADEQDDDDEPPELVEATEALGNANLEDVVSDFDSSPTTNDDVD